MVSSNMFQYRSHSVIMSTGHGLKCCAQIAKGVAPVYDISPVRELMELITMYTKNIFLFPFIGCGKCPLAVRGIVRLITQGKHKTCFYGKVPTTEGHP